jgi:hypothetical protein
MTYKYSEIKDVLTDWLDETKHHQGFDFSWYINKLISDGDLHHEVYNTDYFIIGTYQAKEWMGNEAFNIIGLIKDYEQDNFGEVSTDLSCPERVVNMYAYIIGEEVVRDFIDNEWDAEEHEEELEEEQPELVEGVHYLKAEREADSDWMLKITTPRKDWPSNWRELLLMVDGNLIKQGA